MFWSGNYIAVRELKFLLKEENVTLTQVLEADDILQECQADNKALIQFLTRPDILAELVTHVTEEPSKNVELALQYRYANTASEVMASNISTLRDRLSIDVVQMNRLCDFVATDTTLNPLLSSFYSKTIDMLLQRNPKQDGYLHHIVSLRVLDFFKSRRDFLPNLLRNISTSAICDIFKMFLALKDPFNKIIIEWFDEHQFLESLIQIICGTYGDPPPRPATIAASDPSSAPDPSSESGPSSDSGPSSASAAPTEIAEDVEKSGADDEAKKKEEEDAARKEERERQWRRRFAARNAAALLCDVAVEECCGDGAACGCGARALAARLRGEDAVRGLLQAVFTAPARARRAAVEHACDVLLALLRDEPDAADGVGGAGGAGGAEGTEELERGVAPHLPLLHHALLRADEPAADDCDCDLPRPWRAVGTERLAVAALLARLACSEVDDVPNALITLGTPGVLIDMFFEYPNNNFLHKSVCALVRNARANRRFGDRYTAYLIGECDLLERFMHAFEENENLNPPQTRAGYMGHLIEALRNFDQNPPLLDSELKQARWDTFRETRLRAVLTEHDTPLGGVYPSENTYEMTDTIGEPIPIGYDFLATADGAAAVEEEANEHVSIESREQMIRERCLTTFDDNMWDDTPDDDAAPRASSWPWEGGVAESAAGADGDWAQFDAFGQCDTFAPSDTFGECDLFERSDPFWPSSAGDESSNVASLQRSLQQCDLTFEDEDKDALTILLAQKMLTAFRNMPSDERLLGDTRDTQATGTSSDTQAAATSSDTQAAGSSNDTQAAGNSNDTQATGISSDTQSVATSNGTQTAGTASATQTVSIASETQVAGTASEIQNAVTAVDTQDACTDSNHTSDEQDTTASDTQADSGNDTASNASASDANASATESAPNADS